MVHIYTTNNLGKFEYKMIIVMVHSYTTHNFDTILKKFDYILMKLIVQIHHMQFSKFDYQMIILMVQSIQHAILDNLIIH